MRILHHLRIEIKIISGMISPVHTWVAGKTGLAEILDNQTLRAWQNEKLKELVRYAGKKTRYYAVLKDFTGEISDLPFTRQADIAADPMAFLAIPPSEVERITTLTTSGTTGIRKRVFFSANDIERIINYFSVGMRTLTARGWHTEILISDDTVNSLGDLLRSALLRIGVTSHILSVIPDVHTAISASKEADCLVGMPAEILYMCRTDPGLRPKTILLTADYVPESVIRSISETWKCHVFTHYGMTETGFGYAVDCEHHEGHHTRDADVLVEIINPNTGLPSGPGEKGEIVLTMLTNEAMPLIRYRTGDLSHFINTPCKCGSNLKRLGKIFSRYEDDIQLPQGHILNMHILDEIMFSFPFVRAFTASFLRDRKESQLHLLIDSMEKVDPGYILPLLPKGVEIHLLYDSCDPFRNRGKRRLHRDLSYPALTGMG